MYVVSFSFDDERIYTTQPMNADRTIAFVWDAGDQGMSITSVDKLSQKRMLP